MKVRRWEAKRPWGVSSILKGNNTAFCSPMPIDVRKDGITEGPVGRIVGGGDLDKLLELIADVCVALDGNGRKEGLSW
jgi:hypothetical protein